MARKRPPDEIVPPLPNVEMRLAVPQAYITRQGDDWTHISSNRLDALCGVAPASSAAPLVTMDPMGKPRCRKCLELAGIEPLPDEPNPITKGNLPEVARVMAETQDVPIPAVVPELKMPPADFFTSVRKG